MPDAIFFFFETEPLQDDPPVYYFEARISSFIRIADSLSVWFLEQSLDPWTHIDAIRKKQPFPTLYSETLSASTPRERNIRHEITPPTPRGAVAPVDDSFGEKLRDHYRNHIQAAHASTETSFSAIYLRAMYRDHFEGLSVTEIDHVRQAQSVDFLPLVFRQFLQVMGRGDGNIFVGCDRGIKFLLSAKAGLQEILKISSRDFETPELPPKTVVFLALQGVEFFFFEAIQGLDDPPVWLYIEGESVFYQISSTLSAWFWEQAFDPTGVVKPIDN